MEKEKIINIEESTDEVNNREADTITEVEIRKIPTVALRGLTVLPEMVIHFDLSRKPSITAVEKAMTGGEKLFLITQRDPEIDIPSLNTVYEVGTVAVIKQVTKMPGNIVRVMVEGRKRAKLISFDSENTEYLMGEIEDMAETDQQMSETESEAMLRSLRELFEEYSRLYPTVGKTLIKYFNDTSDLLHLMNQLAINMPLAYTSKQRLLETETIKERFDLLAGILYNESEIAKTKNEIAQKIKERVDKHQREYLLREQMAYIREELGENNEFSDAERFEEAVKKLKADKEVKDKILREIARFKNLGSNNSEGSVERTYIETLLELPWNKASKDSENMETAESTLRKEHYGLEDVKERILESLAIRCLTKKGESPILCLVGPPGTGKTSIARSIAEALGKKYVRICLGGVRDEAEIRGHRRTYIGAMPGRIANGLRQAGVKNPLMLLDEIDKVSSDYKGDTSSALLEVLDSEQNSKFRDHYVEIPLDLSEVLFIATANSVETIPRPLLDRMELIEVSSYTENEKFHIAREHLMRKQFEKNGMKDKMLQISDGAIRDIITYYTREAGVRNLERKIGSICRKAAREILKNDKKTIRITSGNLEKYLGKRKYSMDKANETDEVGIVRGLAWTSVGGDTLQIEVNVMPGKGEIQLTGKLGDVMKESAMTGLSYVRSISEQYGIKSDFFSKHDFHIHIPEGAVPKDGPSAGITMATALLSAITEIPVHCKLAMTGEITLRGHVLPIGGLKEKTLAAKMAGITKVLVPAKNRKDVDEISKEITGGLEIVYVENMEEVIAQAFVRTPARRANQKGNQNGNKKRQPGDSNRSN